MSTYTDLHNRVQESINVDYKSRITPQKVKLLNAENEYWGTFKGKVQAEDIALTGGTFSGVTITDATLDNVKFSNVSGLQIDMTDYAKTSDLTELVEDIDDLTASVKNTELSVQTATTKVNNALMTLDTVSTTLNARVDDAVQKVDSNITTLNGIIDGKISLAVGDLQLADKGLQQKIDALFQSIDAKDSVADRQLADVKLSTDLTALIQAEKVSRSQEDERLLTAINKEVEDRTKAINEEAKARTDAVSDEAKARQDKDTELEGAIDIEQRERKDADLVLDGKISAEETARQEAITQEQQARASEIASVRKDYANDIAAEAAERKDADNQLKKTLEEQIANVNHGLQGEITLRIDADNTIKQKLDVVSTALAGVDQQISGSLTATSAALSDAIDTVTADLLSTIEHDRHYKLNSSYNGYSTTDTYPLKAQDMAVNVYDMALDDGKLVYDSNGKKVEVGSVVLESVSPLKLTVKTFADIKDDNITSALGQNEWYVFENGERSRPTGKGYTLQLDANAGEFDLLSSKFRLVPDVVQYYNVSYNDGANVRHVGKVYDAQKDVDGKITSARCKIEFDDSILSTFNKFNGTVFDNDTNISTRIVSESMTFDFATQTLTFKRGLDDTKYASLLDTLPGNANIEFGRVQDHYGQDAGVVIENDEVQRIGVASIDPIKKLAWLDRSNDFKAVISSDVPNYIDGKTYNYYVSADVDATSATFTTYKAAVLNRYAFIYTKLDGEDEVEQTSYVTPILYNYTIADGYSFLCAEVDLREVPVYQRFKQKWMLEKVAGKQEWIKEVYPTNEAGERDGSWLIIKYNLASLYISYSTPGEHEVVRHEYAVQTTPSPDAPGADDSSTIVLHKSGLVDLVNFPATEPVPAGTYVTQIDWKNATELDSVTYDLSIDTTETDLVKIEVPSKADWPLNNQISREFFVVMRLKALAGVQKPVQIKFIDADGNDIAFYNNKKRTLHLTTGGWTTLQLNEIKPSKFLVTDLNQNEDRQMFHELNNAISTETKVRKEETKYLSDEILSNDSDISSLRTDVNDIRGTVETLSGTDIPFLSGKLSNLSADAFSLSSDNIAVGQNKFSSISALELTADSAVVSTLTVPALSDVKLNASSTLQDTINGLTSQINNTTSDLNERLDTVRSVVDCALSGNAVLPVHNHQNEDGSVTSLCAVVSKLVLVDEVTYDMYALTIRNGALNIDKVGHYKG